MNSKKIKNTVISADFFVFFFLCQPIPTTNKKRRREIGSYVFISDAFGNRFLQCCSEIHLEEFRSEVKIN